MSDLKLIHNYKNNKKYRLSFNRLSIQSFGINLEEWYKNGFWDDRYNNYSFADGDEVVSNISACKMDLIINHERKKAIQICAVGTHPDYRKRGLSRELMKLVLEKHEKEADLVFLLGNKTVLEFYPKFGFKPVLESKFELKVGSNELRHNRLQRLDAADAGDIDFVSSFAALRRPVSTVMGVENSQNFLMWSFFSMYAGCFYYLQEEDVIIACRQEDRVLHIYDIISRENVLFLDLVDKIAGKEVETIVFHFTPDLLHIEAECSPLTPDDPIFHDMFFVKAASFDPGECFRFPATTQL